MFKGPCKDCPDRHYLCHSECEKYIAYTIIREAMREQKTREKRLENDLWLTSRHAKKKKRGRPYADNRGGR